MMPSPARHLVQQRAMILSLGVVAVDSVLGRLRPGIRRAAAVPGPEVALLVPSPSDGLIDDFLRHVGGDPAEYDGVIPPHLFPQWGLSLALRALRGCGYPLVKMINGGCRF